MHSANTSEATGAQHRGVLIALAIGGCVLVVAACGSSGAQSSATTSSRNLAGLKYADCMRSHAVPGFPDPSPGGGIDLPSSIDPQTPAFQSAQQSCADLQPRADGPRRGISAARQKSFVANAKCMRKHGIPNFPDPILGPGGHGLRYPAGTQFPASAINLANQACAHVGTPLPLGGLAQ